MSSSELWVVSRSLTVSLRVAMTPTFTAYLIGRLVEAFNSRYPGITLTIQEITQERMEMLLNDDALDVGIAFDEVHSPDIEALTLLSESLALMVGKSHPYAKGGRVITLEDFNDQALVLLNTEFATRKLIDRHCRKLDVAPPVIDLTAQGFTLIGGRLDYVDARPIGAIVYRRRLHVINLFVAQTASTERRAAKTETFQGFNIRSWSEGGLNYWAVSDLAADELAEFSDKFETAMKS